VDDPGARRSEDERIGLGPGVLTPSLRHPVVNAAATAALDALAPGRVAVGFGTGFTGRRAMGYGTMTWASVLRYIDAYTALLQGETIESEGAKMRMLHPDGGAPARPITVPIILSAFGPKGCEIAKGRGYGLSGRPGKFPANTFDSVAALTWGTVRDQGDTPGAERDMDDRRRRLARIPLDLRARRPRRRCGNARRQSAARRHQPAARRRATPRRLHQQSPHHE
jgi:hypothetical protein